MISLSLFSVLKSVTTLNTDLINNVNTENVAVLKYSLRYTILSKSKHSTGDICLDICGFCDTNR